MGCDRGAMLGSDAATTEGWIIVECGSDVDPHGGCVALAIEVSFISPLPHWTARLLPLPKQKNPLIFCFLLHELTEGSSQVSFGVPLRNWQNMESRYFTFLEILPPATVLGPAGSTAFFPSEPIGPG
ncbi:ferrichrome ABC transporter permease, partial [Sesbania bispinosa]